MALNFLLLKTFVAYLTPKVLIWLEDFVNLYQKFLIVDSIWTPRCSSRVKLTRGLINARGPRVLQDQYIRALEIGLLINRKKKNQTLNWEKNQGFKYFFDNFTPKNPRQGLIVSTFSCGESYEAATYKFQLWNSYEIEKKNKRKIKCWKPKIEKSYSSLDF